MRDDDEQGPSLPSLESTDELAISAVDEEGNPRLTTESTSIKKTVTDNGEGGTTKSAEPLKENSVENGGKDAGYPAMNSAFITFERQIAAHLAVQVLAHHEPYRMS